MRRVLIAEDNESYRKLLAIHLQRAGYAVLQAQDGAQALALAQNEAIDAIVADLMMPHMDGLSLIRQLRDAGIRTPVLVITAREEFDAMRQSFYCGADDYLVKPVRMEELLLRLEALLRRCGLEKSQDDEMHIGPYTLKGQSLCLCAEDVTISLRLKEFRLLAKLAAYPGKIFTRQELMDDIWGYDSQSDPRTVDTHIKRLREKLACLPQIQIRTVRGLGYRLEKPV